MSKRRGAPICRGNSKIKLRKGVKIRTITIQDSDEEDSPSNVNTDYAQLVQTQVTASGRVGSITMSRIPLLELEDVMGDISLEAGTDGDESAVTGDVVTVFPAVQKKRKKANDSVRLIKLPSLSHPANDSSDKDGFLARQAIRCA